MIDRHFLTNENPIEGMIQNRRYEMEELYKLDVTINVETLEDLETIADILGTDVEEIASIALSNAVEFA